VKVFGRNSETDVWMKIFQSECPFYKINIGVIVTPFRKQICMITVYIIMYTEI